MSWSLHCHTERKEFAIFNSEMKLVKPVYRFLLSKKEEGLAYNSLRAYGYDLMFFYQFLEFKEFSIQDIRKKHLGEFRTWMFKPRSERFVKTSELFLHRESSISGSTWNRIISTVGIFFKWLEINEYEVESDLFSAVNIRQMKKSQKSYKANKKSMWNVKSVEKVSAYITPETRVLIKNNLNERDKLIFDFMYFSGMRIGEIFSIDKSIFVPRSPSDEVCDIQLENSYDEDRDRQTKTGERVVYIPNALYQRMLQYIIFKRGKTNSNKLFVTIETTGKSKKGEALSPDTFRKNLAKACGKANVKFTPHDLRHTFATDVLRITKDIRMAQDILGHKSLDTTQKYVHPADEDIVASLGDIYNTLYGGLLDGVS